MRIRVYSIGFLSVTSFLRMRVEFVWVSTTAALGIPATALGGLVSSP